MINTAKIKQYIIPGVPYAFLFWVEVLNIPQGNKAPIVAKSQGSMTAGADGMTLDDMTEARIARIIASLRIIRLILTRRKNAGSSAKNIPSTKADTEGVKRNSPIALWAAMNTRRRLGISSKPKSKCLKRNVSQPLTPIISVFNTIGTLMISWWGLLGLKLTRRK